MQKRIHFICRGNVFRSRIAEAYLRSRGYRASSSGTIADSAYIKNKLNEQRVLNFLQTKNLSEHASLHYSQLSQASVDASDIIVCMNSVVWSEARKLVRLPSATLVWTINDRDEVAYPVVSDEETDAFIEYTYHAIVENVDRLIQDELH